ncbi:MAG: flap endonuclease [Deltaproteobacteria bacterium]|nr:flap endonuclease [Deltaproteobacteria bacterium]
MIVHLVDGTYELFRAWFGAPKARTDDGREVGAARALLRMWRTWAERAAATHVAFAFDHVIESFRNDLFAGYKTSAGVPAELMAQFELAERVARALGFVVWPMIDFEADDALATGAARWAADPSVEAVHLLSPDKDLAQCVGGKVFAVDRFRDITLDEAGVVAKFGVAPRSIPDWLALVGDEADGIPGIPRWGAKSAATVLARWGRLEDIPSVWQRWDTPVRGAASLSQSLEERRDAAMLYRRLATLRTDAPIVQSLDDLRWRGPDEDALAAVRAELAGSPAPPGLHARLGERAR